MIIHILKNGEQVNDIKGYKVTCSEYYKLASRINQERRSNGETCRKNKVVSSLVFNEEPLPKS